VIVVIERTELVNLLESAGIMAFEVVEIDLSRKANLIVLASDDINTFIKFCLKNEIQTLFYFYGYYDAENYIINLDELFVDEEEKYKNKVFKFLSNGIADYNSIVSDMDFAKPYKLWIYCIYKNYTAAICIDDDWIAEMGIQTKDEKLHDLMIENDNRIQKVVEEKEADSDAEEEKLREELKAFIMQDANFKRCTNRDARHSYITSLLEKKQYRKYDGMFPLVRDKTTFIEEVWSDFRFGFSWDKPTK